MNGAHEIDLLNFQASTTSAVVSSSRCFLLDLRQFQPELRRNPRRRPARRGRKRRDGEERGAARRDPYDRFRGRETRRYCRGWGDYPAAVRVSWRAPVPFPRAWRERARRVDAGRVAATAAAPADKEQHDPQSQRPRNPRDGAPEAAAFGPCVDGTPVQQPDQRNADHRKDQRREKAGGHQRDEDADQHVAECGSGS